MPPKISLVACAQQLVSNVVSTGDTVVDATMGKGHDTLFLSNMVGPNGNVYSFDIQTSAINKTRTLLKNNNINNTRLINCCHSRLASALKTSNDNPAKQISAAMFNLGYLPGGDKSIVTHPDTTLTALNAILPLMANKACITIVAYRGHSGGEAESDAIAEYCASLDKPLYYCHQKTIPQTNNIPPILYTITNFDASFDKSFDPIN